jgi:hypothetical protein
MVRQNGVVVSGAFPVQFIGQGLVAPIGDRPCNDHWIPSTVANLRTAISSTAVFEIPSCFASSAINRIASGLSLKLVEFLVAMRRIIPPMALHARYQSTAEAGEKPAYPARELGVLVRQG